MSDELERLRRWKAEAMPLFDGLQDLGRALDLPLGTLVTGPVAVEVAERLRDRLAAAEAALGRVAALADEWDDDHRRPRTMHRWAAAAHLRDALAHDPAGGTEQALGAPQGAGLVRGDVRDDERDAE